MLQKNIYTHTHREPSIQYKTLKAFCRPSTLRKRGHGVHGLINKLLIFTDAPAHAKKSINKITYAFIHCYKHLPQHICWYWGIRKDE